MIKKAIPVVLLILAILKLGGAEARGQNVPYTMWDILVSGGLLVIAAMFVLFVKDGHAKAEHMSQAWLNQDFAGQNSAVRNQRRR